MKFFSKKSHRQHIEVTKDMGVHTLHLWHALLMFFFLCVAGVVYGSLVVFSMVDEGRLFPSAPHTEAAVKVLDSEKLHALAETLRTRKSEYDALRSTPASAIDPSR